MPPPKQVPWTAAMIGFLPGRLLMPPKPPRGNLASCAEDKDEDEDEVEVEEELTLFHSFRSAPAQNARPAPVNTAHRSEGSASYQSHRRSRAKCCGRGMALSCLGRLSVTSRMCGLGKEMRVCRTSGGGVVKVDVLGEDILNLLFWELSIKVCCAECNASMNEWTAHECESSRHDRRRLWLDEISLGVECK